MKRINIDFNGVKYIGEVHLILKENLKFPEWYGENLDALWDLLTGYIDPCIVDFKGFEKSDNEIKPYLQKVLKVFLEAESKYGKIKVGKVE